MATSHEDYEGRFLEHCTWRKTPSAGTILEGILLWIVGLYLVAASALAVFPDQVNGASEPSGVLVAFVRQTQ